MCDFFDRIPCLKFPTFYFDLVSVVGPIVKELQLKVHNITQEQAVVQWDAIPRPNYPLSLRAFLWISNGNGVKRSIIVNLDSSPLRLTSLTIYHPYVAQLTVNRDTLLGVDDVLRSKQVAFTTLVHRMLKFQVYVEQDTIFEFLINFFHIC